MRRNGNAAGRGLRCRQAVAAGAGVLLVIGCGSGEAPQATGPAMAPKAVDVSENRPPEIRRVSLDPSMPVQGSQVRARAQVRDPDGDPVELRYEWRIDGRSLPETSDTTTLSYAGKGEWLEVEVSATDGRLAAEPVVARTRVGNRRPELRDIDVAPRGEVAPGQTVTVRADASDPDGDPVSLRYTWRVNGRVQGGSTPTFSTDSLAEGDVVVVRVEADDGEDLSTPLDGGPVRIGKAPNEPPTIVSTPAGAEDGLFRYQVEAEDPEGDKLLRYRLAQAPEGMQIDPVRGEVTWRPRADQKGVHRVEVVVRDSAGAARAQTFEVTVGDEPEAPPTPAAPAP